MDAPGSLSGTERACVMDIAGNDTIAVLHEVSGESELGVLLIVGGPQYRVGSHRQFVLLARALARSGYPVFRFDYRGIGDSEGDPRDFETIGADIEAAIDYFTSTAGVRRVVIWGLCDAASAALMYAYANDRVVALILANPWVHSPRTEAQARVRTYYMARLRNRDFWRKLVRGQLDLRDSVTSLANYAGRLVGLREERHRGRDDFIERMRTGLANFRGSVFLLLSGDDLVASEFRQRCEHDSAWRSLAAERIRDRRILKDANHTFSSAVWRAQVEQQAVDWLKRIEHDA